MEIRHEMVVGVHLILRDGDKILLARRYNTGWGDGSYNFPCGHLDPNENIKPALAREALEEVSVTINPKDLKFIGATHCISNKQSVNFFFECTNWSGKVANGEPHKCDDIKWFTPNNPPEHVVEQTKDVLNALTNQPQPFFIEITDM